MSQDLGELYRAISTYLIKKTGFTVASGAMTRAETPFQPIGSALNLKIHFHMFLFDGVYSSDGSRPGFNRTPPLTPAEFARLVNTMSRQVDRLPKRGGFLVRDPEHNCLDLEPGEALDQRIGPYPTRFAIADERFSINERGQVIYKFRQPSRDGTIRVVLDATSLVARLAALVPRLASTLLASTACSPRIAGIEQLENDTHSRACC